MLLEDSYWSVVKHVFESMPGDLGDKKNMSFLLHLLTLFKATCSL